MSYRSILVPVAQPDHVASALEAAFLVARRFAGHVCALHVLPDLADPATHALMATRMSLEAATSDFLGSKLTLAELAAVVNALRGVNEFDIQRVRGLLKGARS